MCSTGVNKIGRELATEPGAVVEGSTEPTSTPVISTINGVTNVVIHLSPAEGEAQVGTATFISTGSATTVEISIEPPSAEAQPIHVHSGICTEAGAVRHALQNVVKGGSTTIINLPLAEIVGDGALVNVHTSYSDPSNYTSCGQLPTSLP